MRNAGYTAVGEFHYVHHQPDGTPYARPNALAEAVCEAAEEVGIRIVLLLTAYERGGFGRPPDDGQRRFCDPTVEAYLERLEALQLWGGRPAARHRRRRAPLRARGVGGVAARIAEHCADHDLVLHLHADEQPREIAETLAATGLRPVELIERAGALSHHTTIVHGTHCDDAEVALLAARGATVCACPSTEANLGDGYVPAARLLRAGVPVSVGSDSNTLLDPFVELRELEHVARRTALRRNVLVADGDERPGAVPAAVRLALGRALAGPARAPVIEAGAPADLIALDLAHPEIAGVADEHLRGGDGDGGLGSARDAHLGRRPLARRRGGSVRKRASSVQGSDPARAPCGVRPQRLTHTERARIARHGADRARDGTRRHCHGTRSALAADALAELRVEPLDLLQERRRMRLLLVGDASHLLARALVGERERLRLEPVDRLELGREIAPQLGQVLVQFGQAHGSRESTGIGPPRPGVSRRCRG